MKRRLSDTNPPAPPGLANGIFARVVEDGIEQIAVHVPAGGGAGAIYRTPFDIEPAGTVEGRGDFYNNADVISRQNALGVWQTHGPIFPLERPLAKPSDISSRFDSINQGTATVDVTHSGIHIMAPAGSGLHAWVRPIVASSADLAFHVSHDPHDDHWEEVFSIVSDPLFTPDEIGFFVSEESNVFNLRATLLHWLEEGITSPPSGTAFAAGFISNFFGIDYQAFGIFVRESSSGKMIAIQQTSTASGLLLEVRRYGF